MLEQAINAFFQAAAVSVESLSGTPCESLATASPVAESEVSSEQRQILWQAKLGVSSGLQLVICSSRAQSESLGSFILQSAGLENQDSESLKATLFEVLSQAASGWSQKLAELLGEKVEVQESGETGMAPQGLTYFRIQLRFDEKTFDAFLGVNISFFEKSPAPPPLPALAAVVAGSSAAPFDLLLDVDLPVSISFGRALVPLKEILKLNSGSIVELDRAVTEPVEVIVNNCVIARGEVVVVEGNYGVRIQQIVSRSDRLKSMR
jgi:flagellar motor switch protein FliN/FliY